MALKSLSPRLLKAQSLMIMSNQQSARLMLNLMHHEVSLVLHVQHGRTSQTMISFVMVLFQSQALEMIRYQVPKTMRTISIQMQPT